MSQIDQSALDTLRALQRPGSPDLLGRIIDLFVTQAPESVKAILDGIESADLEIIRTSAHSIKSSAAYVGAVELSAKMANIERAAREEQLSACQDLSIGLEEHTAQVIEELMNLQDKAA